MRALLQRVAEASVTVDGDSVGQISRGLLVYLGVAPGDTEEDVAYLVDKLAGLRVFADEAGKMNLSVRDAEGAILLISNFTLCGDCRKGRRPSFDHAAKPIQAESLYDAVAAGLREQGVAVELGRFGAMMQVCSVNDGPVTFWLDSTRLL